MYQILILCGNLGKDAETRQAGQSTVASFTVAVSERFKDSQGQLKEETEWFECEYWNPGNVVQYLKKGTTIMLEGSIRSDRWTDQNGQPRERKKVRVRSLKLVGKREQQPQQPQAPAGYPMQAPQQAPQYGMPQQPYGQQQYAMPQAPAQQPAAPAFAMPTTDLPF